MSQTFSAAPARHSTYESFGVHGRTNQRVEHSSTKTRGLTPLKPPHASILALAQAGASPTGSNSNNGSGRQMVSAWEDSWGLSGSCSHLKHEVCGAEPSSSKAVEPAAGWGGWRHGAGAGRTQNEREQPVCLVGAGGKGARQVTAGEPAASAPAAWLWSAGTCPSLPRSDASRPLSPSAAVGRAGASPPCSGTHR